MKRKMLKVLIAVIVIVLVVLTGWYVLFSYFGIGPVFPYLNTTVLNSGISSGEISETEPLMALAESEEDAKKIAEQYGITFVAYQEGIATYYTAEDLNQVITRGEENGYSTLYINYQRELSDL